MRRMIKAMIPLMAGSIYFFGWRALGLLAVSCLTAFIAEYLFCRKRNEPVSEAVFVTAIIYALLMPPTVPWHVLIIGVLFSVIITKEIFGGFGRNIFNPAMAGRCFVYICFPIALTAVWSPAAQGPLGGFDQWDTVATPDAVTSATPMAEMKLEGRLPEVKDLFFGRISGTMGATSALLLLIGGIYLFYTKTASRHTILSTVITYAVLNELLFLLGVEGFYGAQYSVLGGGFLFGAFYIATDPISSPRTKPAQVYYGMIIAVGTTVIRNYSIFNGGLMFSILLGNMSAPIIDHLVRQRAAKKKAAASAAASSGAEAKGASA